MLKPKGTCVKIFVIAAMLTTLPVFLHAQTGAKEKKTVAKPAAKRTTRRKTPSRTARRRPANSRSRLAKLQPEPERIQEIQEALIREGYLTQEPTGKWDDATRNAMRHYQESKGFRATGLPEAKTLMKLGLGPHPLPESLDPSVVGSAQINSPAGNTVLPGPQGPPTPR
jgi:peptidoglycan hydrolase-like protein with peptidoglycan-binding domain